jgi:hypothetical protein
MRKSFLFLIAVLNLNTTLMKATFQSVVQSIVLIDPSLVRRYWTTHRTPSMTWAEFNALMIKPQDQMDHLFKD